MVGNDMNSLSKTGASYALKTIKESGRLAPFALIMNNDESLGKLEALAPFILKAPIGDKINYLRGQKTGQVKSPGTDDEEAELGDVVGGINVPLQEARKKKLDADTREFKLNQLRKEYVPVALMVYSVSKLSEMLVSNVSSLPMKMKVADPSLSARSLDKSKQVIADLCNELANFDIDLSDYNPVDQGIDQDGIEAITDSETANGG